LCLAWFHWSNEPEASPWHCLDDSLILAAVADRAPGGIYTAA
jgi:hypothetical protein